MVRMAQENRSWGYDRIVGALANLGYTISDQTVGNILKRHGLPPAPERKTTTTWKEFIRTHMESWCHRLLTARSGRAGTVFFIHLDRKVMPGDAASQHWMAMAPTSLWRVGCLDNNHDRDGKYALPFNTHRGAGNGASAATVAESERLRGAVGTLGQGGVSRAADPVWGSGAAHALHEYVAHYHHERNHQGKDNVLLFPAISHDPERAGHVRCRERLGGLLQYYEGEAA